MNDQRQAVQDAIRQIQSNNVIPVDLKKQLVDTLTPADSPLEWDPWVYRMVVAFLGSAVTFTVVGGLLIVATSGSTLPDGIIALGSAAVGALAGLLAPSPVAKS